MIALIRLDIQRFQTDIFDIGHDPDRDDDMAEFMAAFLAILVLYRRLYAAVIRRNSADARLGHDFHALFGQRLFKEG